MPKLPWTARPDVSPEDASLEALLSGNGLPANAGAALPPVADLLAALHARPRVDELGGLAAARAEFRRRVAAPAHATQSRRWRAIDLVSQIGVKVGAAAAVVAMALGGAAAAAYAGALPTAWQQFAHRTIGAPVHAVGRETRAEKGAARPAAHPSSRHPAYQAPSGGQPAGHGSAHQARPPRHAGLPPTHPFLHPGRLPAAPAVGSWPPPLPRKAPRWPVRADPLIGRDTSVSNAGSASGVS